MIRLERTEQTWWAGGVWNQPVSWLQMEENRYYLEANDEEVWVQDIYNGWMPVNERDRNQDYAESEVKS